MDKNLNRMAKYSIFILFYFQLCCKPASIKNNPSTDILYWDGNTANFLNSKGLCFYTTIDSFARVKTLRSWNRGSNDELHNQVVIGKDSIEIIQAISAKFNNGISYNLNIAINNERIPVTQVIRKDLNSPFWDKIIDYFDSDNVFKYNELILLRNTPPSFSGNSNKYKLNLLIDLKTNHCWQFWTDTTSCY